MYIFTLTIKVKIKSMLWFHYVPWPLASSIVASAEVCAEGCAEGCVAVQKALRRMATIPHERHRKHTIYISTGTCPSGFSEVVVHGTDQATDIGAPVRFLYRGGQGCGRERERETERKRERKRTAQTRERIAQSEGKRHRVENQDTTPAAARGTGFLHFLAIRAGHGRALPVSQT